MPYPELISHLIDEDSQGVCQLINLYILMANWVNPALRKSYSMAISLFDSHRIVIVYSSCLSFLVWWQSRHPIDALASKSDFDDEEASIGQNFKFPPATYSASYPEIASRRPLIVTIPIAPTAPITSYPAPNSKKSSRRPSGITIPTTPVMPTASKTPSREIYSWERDIYLGSNRRESVGEENISRPPMATRLSKQRVPPSVLY